MQWHCFTCGRRFETEEGLVAYFHRCHPIRRPPGRPVHHVTKDDLRTQVWAASPITAAIREVLGDEAGWRPL
jgi:hypothetical protein